ncbi:ATP-binding protein [Oribacterium sp. P6A1]|uniref:ATP-binding protein n=1 Tax=Oribacterium sp. P6A1 TaxID=1410612 RepID=UPI0005650253|nr:ATP-binding protein [Oribacterium sp. P6A1]
MDNKINWLFRRLRILLPVLMVLICFSWSVWFVIGKGANNYLSFTAEMDVDRKLHDVMKETEKPHKNGTDLQNSVKKHFSFEPGEVQLLVFDEEGEEVFHSSGRNYSRELAKELKNALTKGEIGEKTVSLNIDEDMYKVAVFKAGKSEKSYILYKKVENAGILLRQMRYYILWITAPMLLIAAIAIFYLSNRLEKREREMERQREHEKMILEAQREKEKLTAEMERERADEAAKNQAEREKLFRDISHDLRTPLVSIIGYADGIKRGIISDTERAAAVIVREGERIQRLLESSLTLSKLDSDSWPGNKVTLSLNELISEQVEALEKLDDSKKLVFEETEETADDIFMTTDPDLLIRIVQNIVSDCMRYAETAVEIKLMGGEFAHITISDDGPGIAEEDLPHMFELYYKGKDGKYGIGLSVVASAVKYLGGSITVKNKEFPGHGAVYSLMLPLAKNA